MELWNAERAVRCWWWRRSQQAVQRWREIIKVKWTESEISSGTVQLICKIENNNSRNNFTENLLGFVSRSKKLIQRRMKRTKTISWCKTWCWDKLARLDGKIFLRQRRSSSKVGNRSSAIPIKREPVWMTTKGAQSLSTISFHDVNDAT